MPNEVKIQHPAVQTRLPEHEQAARKQRAAVVGLPRPQQPPAPFVRALGARKTWHVAWPDPNGKDEGRQEFRTHPSSEAF